MLAHRSEASRIITTMNSTFQMGVILSAERDLQCCRTIAHLKRGGVDGDTARAEQFLYAVL